MRFFDQPIDFEQVQTAPPVWRAEVRAHRIVGFCTSAKLAGGRLVALWGSDRRHLLSDPAEGGFMLHLALALEPGLVLLDLPLASTAPVAPDLACVFPSAGRLQRTSFDLLGIRHAGDDTRPWLRNGGWPAEHFPLRHDQPAGKAFPQQVEAYDFVRVEGDGVHEIPVGPIHAGIIEPGHFRFSIVGERVLRLEERLGYVHKGIEKRFESLQVHEGHRLAGRVSGDSTVACAWAYCMAAEALSEVEVPLRAAWLRALLLERERVANHLGDLGYLGNDAALGFGLAQFSRLKEDWLRLNAELFGHRLLMDRIVPGGTAVDITTEGGSALIRQCEAIEREVQLLKHIYDEHPGLQDRFLTTGRLTTQLASRLGVIGLAGRASGQAWDLRCRQFHLPYDQLEVRMAGSRQGDVAARVAVRFDEVFESLRLIRLMCDELCHGDKIGEVRVPYACGEAGRRGTGWIEGWRGEVLVGLEAGDKGLIRRCHVSDPSWHNWPALEHAIMGNIVPDFPLINKSFNLSYSGVDM